VASDQTAREGEGDENLIFNQAKDQKVAWLIELTARFDFVDLDWLKDWPPLRLIRYQVEIL